MAVLELGGHALYHEEHGSGAPIVGIHGSPSTAVFWEEPAALLARLGRVVLYDRQGYHRSTWRTVPDRVDLADHLADLEALLGHVGGGPAVVVGRSTGGLIAVALAVARPHLVRALVLLEPALFSLHPEAQAFADELRGVALEAARPGSGSAQGAVRAVLSHALGSAAWEGFSPEVRELFLAGGPAVLAEVRGRGLDLSEHPFTPEDEELARVTVPTLVVSGDASYPAARHVDERLVTALPRARHVVVGGGHLVDPAHPAVLDFVAEVLARD